MKLLVVTSKFAWEQEQEIVTLGGFPIQMKGISELFDETHIIMFRRKGDASHGTYPINGKKISIRLIEEPMYRGVKRKLRFLAKVIPMIKIIYQDSKKYDAIHALIPGDLGTLGMFVAFFTRKPLLVRHCGNWLVQETFAERMWKWIMEKFAGNKNIMLATGGGQQLPSSKNPYIKWIFSTSVLTENLLMNEKTKKYNLANDPKLILVARQEHRKGTGIMLEVVERLKEYYPNIIFTIIGDGSALDDFKQQTQRLKIQKHINFTGFLPQKEIANYLLNSDIFCFPTSASEGFPKVIQEALACGLPILTSNVSVLPKIINDHNCGYLIDVLSVDDISQKILKIWDNKEHYLKLSKNSFRAASYYTIEKWQEYIQSCCIEAWDITDTKKTNKIKKIVEF